MKYGKAWANLGVMIGLILLTIYVLPRLLLLFMPFFIGWFLALLANPPVHFFEEKLKIKRKAGSALVIIFVLGAICIFFYFITVKLMKEISDFVYLIPQMWENAEQEVMVITAKWESVIQRFPKEVVNKVEEFGESMGKEMGSLVGELSLPTAGAVGRFTQRIPNMVISLIMCLLSSYFFVAQKGQVEAVIKKRIPRSWGKKILLLKQTTIDVLIGYLKAQLKIEVWIYLILAAGLLFLKVRYGYLIALPIAFLDLLPIFGTGTILVPWAVFKGLTGDYIFALGILVIWGISQLVRQIIQPKMIGESMGMPALPTLILLYVGYRLAGVAGMIFAVPLGILTMAMNEAGFFDNCKMSIKIIWQGFQRFRSFTPEEKKEVLGEENEKEL